MPISSCSLLLSSLLSPPRRLEIIVRISNVEKTMLRRGQLLLVAPWVPSHPGDVSITRPPPPQADFKGFMGGVSVGYSDRIGRTPHWRRMAMSTYEERIEESNTYFPFASPITTALPPTHPSLKSGGMPSDANWRQLSNSNDGRVKVTDNNSNFSEEYSTQYLPKPYADTIRNRPLFEVGESATLFSVRIPVIFLEDVINPTTNTYHGKRLETVYVTQAQARNELIPERLAVYATPEAYRLLGLPPVDHKMHETVIKTVDDKSKLVQKQQWNEERWKFSVDYLFRKHAAGPPELQDVAEEWDGEELVVSTGETGAGSSDGAVRKGPVKQRKARKIKLF